MRVVFIVAMMAGLTACLKNNSTDTFIESNLEIPIDVGVGEKFRKIEKADTRFLCAIAVLRTKENYETPFNVNLVQGSVNLDNYANFRVEPDGGVLGIFAMRVLSDRLNALATNYTKSCNRSRIREPEPDPFKEMERQMQNYLKSEKSCYGVFMEKFPANRLCPGKYWGLTFLDAMLDAEAKKGNSPAPIAYSTPSVSCRSSEALGTVFTTCY